MTRASSPGDPTSISRLATDALRAGEALAARADGLASALPAGAPSSATARTALTRAEGATRSDRIHRDLEARTAELVAVAAGVAGELSRMGHVLQQAASDLADTRAELGRLRSQVEAAGYTLDAGRVLHPWGINGVADCGDGARREADRLRLQRDWDAVHRVLARRRGALVSALTASRSRWADWSARLAR